MQINITHRPGNSAAKVSLEAGESITAEGGAMIAMSGHMQVETTTHKKDQGSILGAIKRLVTGESLFLNHFTPSGGPGEVYFGTALSGDIHKTGTFLISKISSILDNKIASSSKISS